VSREREPDTRLARGIEGERHHVLLVRDAERRCLLGMGSRSVRRVFVNGTPARVGYLGQLRVPALHGRLRSLTAGYRAIRSTHRPDELPFDLTSVVADNARARRILEGGLPGMPRYRPIAELETSLFPARGRRLRDRRPGPVGMRTVRQVARAPASSSSRKTTAPACAAC